MKKFVEVDPEFYKELWKIATEKRCSVRALVNQALREELKKEEVANGTRGISR